MQRLHLSEPVTPPDTRALLEILDSLRGCNTLAENICLGIARFSAMAVDNDGVSRGLVGAMPSTEPGKGTVLAIYLECGPIWKLHFSRTTGEHVAELTLNVPHRIWRQHAMLLAPMIGVAA